MHSIYIIYRYVYYILYKYTKYVHNILCILYIIPPIFSYISYMIYIKISNSYDTYVGKYKENHLTIKYVKKKLHAYSLCIILFLKSFLPFWTRVLYVCHLTAISLTFPLKLTQNSPLSLTFLSPFNSSFSGHFFIIWSNLVDTL